MHYYRIVLRESNMLDTSILHTAKTKWTLYFTKKFLYFSRNLLTNQQTMNIMNDVYKTKSRARGTFFEVGVLKKLECSEWSEQSVNQRGVHGPAVGPLVGSRATPLPGVQGAELLEAQRFQTFEYSLMGLFWDLFVPHYSGHKLIKNWRKS